MSAPRKIVKLALLEAASPSETWPSISDFWPVAKAIGAIGVNVTSDEEYSALIDRLERQFDEDVVLLLDKHLGNPDTNSIADHLHYHQHLEPAIRTIKEPDFIERLNRAVGRNKV